MIPAQSEPCPCAGHKAFAFVLRPIANSCPHQLDDYLHPSSLMGGYSPKRIDMDKTYETK